MTNLQGNTTTKKVDLLVSRSSSHRQTGASGSAAMSFAGLIDAVAFVHQKESAKTAVGFLVDDIVHSVLTRLDLLLDDLEEETGHSLTLTALESSQGVLPKRVFVPCLDFSVLFCDYLFPDEKMEVDSNPFYVFCSHKDSSSPCRISQEGQRRS